MVLGNLISVCIGDRYYGFGCWKIIYYGTFLENIGQTNHVLGDFFVVEHTNFFYKNEFII